MKAENVWQREPLIEQCPWHLTCDMVFLALLLTWLCGCASGPKPPKPIVLKPAQFNADGNLTRGPLTSGTFVSHTFDGRHRLREAGGTSVSGKTGA